MKTKIFLIWIVLVSFLISCQSATPTPLPSTQTPPGQMETNVAATIYVNQTSTAVFEQALAAALTAAVPSSTNTPVPTSTPGTFHVSVPGSACWMNSNVNVHTGQKVVINAFGVVNTWGGRDGSSSGPNGQKGICGAIECPLQGVGYGALIGRLEDLPSFFVGTELEFVATKDGQLYFTTNDWTCQDNSGTFELVITFP